MQQRKTLYIFILVIIVAIVLVFLLESRYKHTTIRKDSIRAASSKDGTMRHPLTSGYYAEIRYGWDRKGPSATLRLYDDTTTLPLVILTPEGIDPGGYISGIDRFSGMGQLIGLTVADNVEGIPPFPSSYMYIDNLDRDPDPEIFIYQCGRENSRMFPISSGAYKVDFDSSRNGWEVRPLGGVSVFWRIGEWRVFFVKIVLGIIGLCLALTLVLAKRKSIPQTPPTETEK